MKTTTFWFVSVIASLGLAGSVAAGEMKQTTTMHWFEDMSVVDDAKADLVRMDNGIYMNVKTNGLEPGHVVTMWYVVFNNPEYCSGGECGEDDVFNLNADGSFIFNADGTPPMNEEAWDAIGISLLRADGVVIGEDGTADLRGHLPVGDTIEAVAGPGLLDPYKAEVHAVLRDHMEPKADMLNDMINSMNAGCSEAFPNEPCHDPQFAIFKPAN